MTVLGVVGAGTMGAGIAQLGAAAGMRTLLHDPVPEALERGAESARRGLAQVGREGPRRRGRAPGCSSRCSSLDELAPCELVIEAAPERAELKRDLFGALSLVCGDDVVLATNTSSIPVTSLAGAAARPENVVGMHFFNPPPLMPLLEVIRADQTSDEALRAGRGGGRRHGQGGHRRRRRPGLPREPLRAPVQRRGAAAASGADRHARPDRPHLPARRRLPHGPVRADGPGRASTWASRSRSRSTSSRSASRAGGRARSRRAWSPPGRLGRKSGRGYYDYAEDGSYRPEDPEPPAPGGGDGDCASRCSATAPLADGLRERARARRLRAARGRPGRARRGRRAFGPAGDRRPARRSAASRRCAPATSLAARGESGAVGFHLLPPLEEPKLVELTRLPTTQSFALRGRRALLREPWLPRRVGRRTLPGSCSGRIVGQLVNEAAFAIGEGVGVARRRGHRPDARPLAPARAGRLERGDRAGPRARAARRALGRAPRGALPGRPAAPARGGARA